MVSVTLAIPGEIKSKMEQFSEINWSGFIRKAIIEKAQELELKEKLKKQLEKEEDTNKWALELEAKSRKNRINELKKRGLI